LSKVIYPPDSLQKPNHAASTRTEGIRLRACAIPEWINLSAKEIKKRLLKKGFEVLIACMASAEVLKFDCQSLKFPFGFSPAVHVSR